MVVPEIGEDLVELTVAVDGAVDLRFGDVLDDDGRRVDQIPHPAPHLRRGVLTNAPLVEELSSFLLQGARVRVLLVRIEPPLVPLGETFHHLAFLRIGWKRDASLGHRAYHLRRRIVFHELARRHGQRVQRLQLGFEHRILLDALGMKLLSDPFLQT